MLDHAPFIIRKKKKLEFFLDNIGLCTFVKLQYMKPLKDFREPLAC